MHYLFCSILTLILQKGQKDPSDKLDIDNLEDYVAHHHDMIILTAIDEAKRIAEEDIQEMQKK